MKPSVAGAILFGAVGVAILVGLGVWQVQRLAWKEGIIARLDARLAAAPVVVPDAPDPERDAFLRVTLNGTVGEDELHVLTSLRPRGPGFRVIVAVGLAGGRRVLADLGYVPEALKDRAARPLPAGPVAITGALYWPGEADSFTPVPDLGRNIWFARDLAAMSAALGTEPLMVVADTTGFGTDWPLPRRLGADLPNRHLGYAITWFSLAVVWAVMGVALVRRERRRE